MVHIREGEWVKYRHHEGWTSDGKVLEKRPDGHLVIGSHDNDPEPDIVERGRVIARIG